jgi:hypothetical protein
MDFSEKFGINPDCLADRSNSLIAPLRQGAMLYLTVKIRMLAIEAIYNDSKSAFDRIKDMKEEFEALQIPMPPTFLDKLFMERLIKLISRCQEMQNLSIDNNDKMLKLVDKITELITIADWLNLDINRNYLENRSYDAYLLYKENPKKYEVLKPMLQWLNFEV